MKTQCDTTNEFSRTPIVDVVEVKPGEKRGYWKTHAPDKWFRQEKVSGRIEDRDAVLLFDSGADVSLVDTTFARKVGCLIDESKTQDCVGIGDTTFETVGRASMKITLAGNLVYSFEAWVGDLNGQDAILGMDFMVPAGVRVDVGDGSICLPDEVRVRMLGRRQLFNAKRRQVTLDASLRIEAGQSRDVRLKPDTKAQQQLWVSRGDQWVPTVVKSKMGKTSYLRLTNLGYQRLTLGIHTPFAMWLAEDRVPREYGYVTTHSNRYAEWQNLALGATREKPAEPPREEYTGPLVDHPTYPTPKALLRREEVLPTPTGATELPQSGTATEPTTPQVAAYAVAKQEEGGEDAVCYHEGSDLFAEDVEQEMAVLPEVSSSLTEVVKIEDLKVGKPDGVSPEVAKREQARLRAIIWKKKHLLIGKGNALPPAAVGVECDIDVGGATPVAQWVRKIPPQFREKVFELLKGLLSAGIIRPSTSPWASPIVVIIKKNGVDIRLCIDYRVVNSLTQLMIYPMPLVTDLLEDLDTILWFCSLDMASGFWVVPMTDRARIISAFITPFGLFEWLRMPFGLRNAPQIYQRLVDNALYGILRISRWNDMRDVFKSGEPEDVDRRSVLGRRSYIDDILVGASSWDNLCTKVENLLDTCDRWNLSISVEKSSWGMAKVDYLGHVVSSDGLEAKPKNLDALATLSFPRTLKAMQSFLGSLNYYHRFIADFAVFATVLYGLNEEDFCSFTDDSEARGKEKWIHATNAFEALKAKFSDVPMLRHFDPKLEPVVIVYANDWAISGVLTQCHDGVYMPIKFTSRTLKPNELAYDIVEKEILALLRVLNNCYTMLAGRAIRVLTRHTTLAWLFRTRGLEGRLSQWAAILSPWTLQVDKSTRGEEELLGVLAASIAPRSSVDDALEMITPRKQPRKAMSIPIPAVQVDEELFVVSFDGSAKSKREGGAIVWRLPGWTVVKAASGYDVDLTVNEAEYRGLLLALDLLEGTSTARLLICGDSNLAIRQLREEMDCKSLGLQLLRKRCWDRLRNWPKTELMDVRRDWNASADLLAGQALQRQAGVEVTDEAARLDLQTLNRLDEVILVLEELGTPHRKTDVKVDPASNGKKTVEEPELSASTRGSSLEVEVDHGPSPRVNAVVTRSAARSTPREGSDVERAPAPVRRRTTPTTINETLVQRLRLDRISKAQDEERWMYNLKQYLRGDVSGMTAREASDCSKKTYRYEEAEGGLLFYCTRGDESAEDRSTVMKLVIPETLRDDVLHHYHASLEGGHQGVGRTYHRIRRHFHWPGLYRSVQRYVGECVDCETGKGRPTLQGESPGNIVPTYSFQVIAMDHIPSLPASYKGNTELLMWVDLYTGFVMAKANTSREAQTVAESYEECVFRRFGASEAIRHDREPGFMSAFFRAFNQLMGQRQRATLAYRPQANGSAERMVQTITRAIKMYVEDEDQRDWDEYAERLTFALNTSYDRVRRETPFFLVHGWDPRTTIEAALSVGNTQRLDSQPRRWRFHIQKHYMHARAQATELLAAAIEGRAEAHNEHVSEHTIEVGTQVWLYLDRVRPGYARKLAHMWHGPFRVEKMVSNYAVKLAIAGTDYRIYPVVHVSKLKPVRQYPTRPSPELRLSSEDRLDFDEELLPEDSWVTETLGEGVFEVEEIREMRTGRRTRYGRHFREFKVKWRGYDETTWVDEANLNCGGLLYDFLRERTRRQRFGAMQSAERDGAEEAARGDG